MLKYRPGLEPRLKCVLPQSCVLDILALPWASEDCSYKGVSISASWQEVNNKTSPAPACSQLPGPSMPQTESCVKHEG